MLCCVSETKGQDQPEDENAAKDGPELEQGEPAAAAAAAAACCDSDNATDPTNKHTTRALCAHVASPWPGADGQGVDAGRGDRLPEAAAGAGAGDEPDEQHDDAHGDAAAADVRRHGAVPEDEPAAAAGPAQQFVETVSCEHAAALVHPFVCLIENPISSSPSPSPSPSIASVQIFFPFCGEP